MSKQNIESKEYKELKAQYDSLLEKNQNDLISVKQRENSLDIKEEAEKKYQDMSAEYKIKIEELEGDVRKIMEQNIELTANNTAMVVEMQSQQQRNRELEAEIDQLKTKINALNNHIENLPKPKENVTTNSSTNTESSFKDEQSNTEIPYVDSKAFFELEEKHKQTLQELSKINQKEETFKRRVKELEDEISRILEKDKKTLALLRKKENEIVAQEAEMEKLRQSGRTKRKKTEYESGMCEKCKETEHEINLLKEMVRSQKGMVRAKSIEVEKYKLHQHVQEVNATNSSKLSKNGEKSGLPPIKKK